MRRYLALIVALAALASPAAARQPWRTSGAAQFAAGTLEGISVLSTGELQLAPPAQKIEGLEADFVWDIEVAHDGTVYVGTGSPGAVYRLAGDDLERLHHDEDIQVLSVLPLPDGSVLAGTGPEGVILRINRRGEVSTFAELEGRYVWDMALGPDHRIYCATGPEGRLYRLDRGGDVTELLNVPQRNLMCVVVDGAGTVYAGTSPGGLLYAVDRRGQSRVLFDAEEDEIHDIVIGYDGVIYVCTAQGEARPAGPASPEGRGQQAEPPPGMRGPVPGAPRAANSIYRIEPEQGASLLARFGQVFVLSVGLFEEQVLAGTGPGGRLMAVAPDGAVEMVLDQFEPAYVKTIAVAPEGDAFIGTANPGELWRLERGFRPEGTFVSSVHDAGYLSRWGRLQWQRAVGVGQDVRVRVRTGNSREPDEHWSEWSRWSSRADGQRLDVPMGRFAQFSVEMTARPRTGTPRLWGVEVSYRQANRRPRIEDMTLNGRSLLRPPDDDQPARARRQAEQARQRAPNEARGAVLNLEWRATDPNEDELAFDLYYRGLDEAEWKPLEQDIRDRPAYQWDTARVPDGRYLVRLVARDDVSRPPEEALSAERVTPPILIDNRPPAVESLQARRLQDGRYELTGVARDEFSGISEIVLSRNAGPWRPVFPDDGIFDSPEEPFTFRTEVLEPGEHVFVVSATDERDNVGSARIVVNVP